MRKLFLIAIMAIPVIFASCSQNSEDDSGVSQDGTESVASLVGKLRKYDANFAPRRQPLLSKSDKKNKLTWKEWLKVGIADVKGALTGASGGWGAATVGAAVASIEKYVEIIDKKGQKKDNVEVTPSTSMPANSASMSCADSIGYYHNLTEELLYDKYGNGLRKIPMSSLVSSANYFMRNNSAGYCKHIQLTSQDMTRLGNQLGRIKSVKDSASVGFYEYCDKLRHLTPRDSSYVDFAAEYLYTCVCANVGDIREYTCDVLRQIDGSNAASNDKRKLSQCILIAFSSLAYSAQMECSDITE